MIGRGTYCGTCDGGRGGGDGIPPWNNGHIIVSEVELAGSCHGEKQNKGGTNIKQ